MKTRSIIAVLLALVVFLSCGCGSKTKASDKAISVAKQAVEVADNYLDGKVSKDIAYDKLNSLYDEMSYVDNLTDSDPNKTEDFYIQLDTLHLSTSVLLNDINNDSKSYDEVIKARNDLAEDAGLKAR